MLKTFLRLFILFLITACVQEIPLEELENEEFVESPSETSEAPAPIVDTTAPILSGLLPSGTLPATSTSATIQVLTNESASCRVDTASREYDLLSTAMLSSDNRLHNFVYTVAVDSSYNFYIRCKDSSGNISNQGVVSFKVDKAGSVDNTAPTLSNLLPSGKLLSGTTQVNLQASTNEGSVCKYSSNQNANFDQMLGMDSSNGTTHIKSVNGLVDEGSYNYWILCKDLAGNLSLKGNISFSIDKVNLDGASLYATNCMSCHGDLANSTKKNRSAQQIQNAIDFNAAMRNIAYLKSLSAPQVDAIAKALFVEVARNNIPAISADKTSVVLFEESLASIKILGVDLDGDSLNYTITNKPAFVESSQTGNNLDLVFKPLKGSEGVYNFSLQASDPNGGKSNTVSVSLEVKKAVAVNNPPMMLLSKESTSIEVDKYDEVIASASDQDGDVLTFSILSKPSFVVASQTGNDYKITLGPKGSDVGSHDITIVVTDSKGGSTSKILSVSVNSTSIDLNQQYAANFANISFRLADRHLLYSMLTSIFGDYAESRSDVIMIRRDRDIFGGGCDHFEQGLLPGSSRYNIQEEFPGYSCNRNQLPEYTTYKANFTTSSSPIRSALVIKACENILSERNYVPVLYALSSAGLTENSTVNVENINKIYRLFYRHQDIPASLASSVVSKRNNFSSSREYWKSVLLGLCTTPWWQEL